MATSPKRAASPLVSSSEPPSDPASEPSPASSTVPSSTQLDVFPSSKPSQDELKIVAGPDGPTPSTANPVTAKESSPEPPEKTTDTVDLEAQAPAPAPAPARGTAQSKAHDYAFQESHLAPWRFWCLSIGICLGLFLAMLDSSIVATSLLTIGRDLGSFDLLNWVALAYTLAYLGCAGVFARLADIVGRRNAFLSAFIVFFGFSLGCGFAKTMNQLIALRALQGVGGSGLYSLSMTIWPEVAPLDLQKHIASLAGVVIGVAGILGPVLGGIITHYTTYKWIFWINGPVGAASLAIFLLTWPDKKHLPHVDLRPWSDLDILGSFLLIAAAVLFTFSFQNAGSDADVWGTAMFIAPCITGVFCWVALFAWEYVLAQKPWGAHMLAAFPQALFRNRVYTCGILNTMFIGFPFFTTIYSVPLRLQLVNGKSPLLAGVMLLPMLGGVAIGSWAAGTINVRFNRVFETLVVASGIVLLGCGLEMTLSDSEHLEAKALGFLVFIGIGSGLVAATSTILAATEAPIGEHAPAQGILAQIRILGGSIGIATSSAIQAQQEKNALGTVPSSSELATLTSSNQSPEEAAIIRSIFAKAFTEDMKVAAVMSGVAMLIAIGTYKRNRVSLLAAHDKLARAGEKNSDKNDTDTTATGKGFQEAPNQGSREAT